MILDPSNKLIRFYGRRKGRSLSETNQLALQEGSKYLIKKSDFSLSSKFIVEDLVKFKPTKIILEIGFGSGENLIKSAKMNPDVLYLGADPFLNTNAKCIQALLNYNIKNIMIWPDDIRQIIEFFPLNIFSEIKILFPDPWPKFKHKNRRIIQDNFLISLYNVLKKNGIIILGTDHFIMKSWILEIFQNNSGFQWTAETADDWRTKPIHYVTTKYEQKAINENRNPHWFIFKKI